MKSRKCGMTGCSQYCIFCLKHTKHINVVNRYATRCTKCNTITDSMGRVETESNVLLTPNGDRAVVVRNDKDNVTFFVEEGRDAGYYFYDKRSGFGAVQKLN